MLFMNLNSAGELTGSVPDKISQPIGAIGNFCTTPVKLQSVQSKPNDEAIKHLERLIEDARRGEILSIAYAVIWRGNTAGNGWTSIDHAERMVGELELLKAKLINECLKK